MTLSIPEAILKARKIWSGDSVDYLLLEVADAASSLLDATSPLIETNTLQRRRSAVLRRLEAFANYMSGDYAKSSGDE